MKMRIKMKIQGRKQAVFLLGYCPCMPRMLLSLASRRLWRRPTERRGELLLMHPRPSGLGIEGTEEV